MKRLIVMGCLLAAVSAWTACTHSKAATGSTTTNSSSENPSLLYDKDWRLVSIQGELVDTAGMHRIPAIRFSKSDHRVSGNGGCNGMGGTYTVTGEKLHFSPLISTKMACPNLSVEDKYFKALNQVTRFEVGDGRLELFSDNGSLLLFTNP